MSVAAVQLSDTPAAELSVTARLVGAVGGVTSAADTLRETVSVFPLLSVTVRVTG